MLRTVVAVVVSIVALYAGVMLLFLVAMAALVRPYLSSSSWGLPDSA